MMPGGLFALGARAYGLLPEALSSRVLPPRLRYDPSALPVAENDRRERDGLLIAPTNFAGQGDAWARAVERARPSTRAVSLAFRAPGTGFGFPVDVEVPASAYVLSRSWHDRQTRAIAAGFSHVLVEAGRPPAGGPYRAPLARQLRDLIASGVRVAYLAHGTDVRVPSVHAAAHPDSPFRSGDHEPLEMQARANIALIEDLGIDAFVSTPDLFEFLPGATWLPVVVDPAAWRATSPVLQRARPIVVHAPSSGPMKGSDAVDPAMAALHDAGTIEYRRIRGVPAAQMPEIYREADIVLEQFRIGGYGVAACEAMAAGRVVVGHVAPDVRRRVSDAAGLDLPIVESAAADIGRVVADIVERPAGFAARAAEGPAFVDALHDGTASARAMSGFLDG